MLWLSIATVLFILMSLPTALLIHRKLRQAKTGSFLKIESAAGIVEEHFVRVGGIDQWVGIRGEDRANPVLLLIHGGPGCSYSIFTPHLRTWEKHFNVVQWDQRGAGRTFAGTGPAASRDMSLTQLTRDGIEVVEYLRLRLHKDRIFLLASSFGSTFALDMARQRPDMFYAYIGTDQNVGMARGCDEDRRQVLERLRALGLRKGVKALERIGTDPTHWTHDDFDTVTRWTMKSDPNGYRRTMKLLKDAVWYAPGWKLKDIRTFVAGMRFSLERMLPEFSRYDAWAQSTRFQVPIFIFQGENDVLTTPPRARDYFDDLVAPIKGMVLIADAGHFAAFLQPEQFLSQLLAHVRDLADTPTMQSVDQA